MTEIELLEKYHEYISKIINDRLPIKNKTVNEWLNWDMLKEMDENNEEIIKNTFQYFVYLLANYGIDAVPYEPWVRDYKINNILN